jgi:hypothetical protein
VVLLKFYNYLILLCSLTFISNSIYAASSDSFNLAIDLGQSLNAKAHQNNPYRNIGSFTLGFDFSFNLERYYGIFIGDLILPDQKNNLNKHLTDNHLFFSGLELHTVRKPWAALVQLGPAIAMNRSTNSTLSNTKITTQYTQLGYFVALGVRYYAARNISFRARLTHWVLNNQKQVFHSQDTFLLGIESYFQ